MNPFWHRVAHILLPNGYRVWNDKEEVQEGAIVIQMSDPQKKDNVKHWWDYTRNATRVQCWTFQWKEGKWYRFGPKQTIVEATSGPCGQQCIVPHMAVGAGALQQGSHIAVFASNLRGPVGIAAGPQELAMRWKHQYGGVFVACSIEGDTQGYFIAPSWQAFGRDIWAKTVSHYRNFHENIGKDDFVPIFFDFDSEDPRVLSMNKAHIIEMLFQSIEEAFQECYPNAPYTPKRSDWHLWSASRPQKVSFHGNTHHGCPLLWRNASRALRSFMLHVRKRFFWKLLGEAEPDANRSKLIDMSVYDPNHKIRLPRCRNRGKPWDLVWWPHPGGPVQEPHNWEEMIIVPIHPLPHNTIIVPEVGGSFVLNGAPTIPGGIASGPSFYVPGTDVHLLSPPLLIPYGLGWWWPLQQGPVPIEWVRDLPKPKHPQGKGGAAAPIIVPSQLDTLIQQEVAHVLGPEVRIRNVTPFGKGFNFQTNIHACPFHNANGTPYPHKSFTQHGFLGRNGWKQWCGDYADPACKGRRLEHTYRNPESILPLLRYPTGGGGGGGGGDITYDEKLYKRMLEACNAYVGSKGIVHNIEEHRIYYAESRQTIRFHGSPAYVWNAQGSRHAVPDHVNDACRAFMRSVRLLPIDVPVDSVVERWKEVAQRVVVDDGPPERDVDYSLLQQEEGREEVRVTFVITRPGGGKTEGLQIHDGDTLVVPEIELAASLAHRKGTAYYRTEDGSRVRYEEHLTAEPKALTGCINSLLKLEGRSNLAQWIIDELPSCLWALAGPGRFLGQQGHSVFAELESRFMDATKVYGLGADMTPEVEGRWLQKLGVPFEVLIKFRQRPVGNTRVLELMSDEEFRIIFIRILFHNRSCLPERRVRVYIHCNTKGAVKRLRALCAEHYPECTAAIFVDSESGVPPAFVADPDSEWIKYEIVCVSPKVKSGVSFKVPNHFDVMLCYATSRTTSTQDVGQALRRVRAEVSLLAYRIVQQGGDDPAPDKDHAEMEALKAYTSERSIQVNVPKEGDRYKWLCNLLQERRAEDQREYVQRARTHCFRQRGMPIELGGCAANQPIDVPLMRSPHIVISLPPLPPGTDIHGPNLKLARLEAIEAADDVSSERMTQLWQAKTHTPKELAEMERYELRREWHAHGSLSFYEYAKKRICQGFEAKVAQFAVVMGPEPAAAAAAQTALVQRTEFQGLLSLLPGFRLNNLRANDGFSLSQEQVEALREPLLQYVEANPRVKRFLSKAQGPHRRIINTFNSALSSVGYPQIRTRKPKKRERSSWGIDFGEDTEALFEYANYAPLKRPLLLMHRAIIITNPQVIEERIINPANGHSFRLAPLPTHLSMVRVSYKEVPFDLTESIAFEYRTLTKDPSFYVEWEWFHHGRVWRFVCATRHINTLCEVLKQFECNPARDGNYYNFSRIPLRIDPQYCLEPCLQLYPEEDGSWTVLADVSRYEEEEK